MKAPAASVWIQPTFGASYSDVAETANKIAWEFNIIVLFKWRMKDVVITPGLAIPNEPEG